MDRQPNSSRAKRSRFLVAADTNIDPHRLVRLCCERAGRETVSVSLLVPGDGEPRVRSAGPAAERLVRKATLLLYGAGIHVEDVIVAGQDNALVARLVRLGGLDALLVCADHQRTSSALLPFADRLAHRHGLTVMRDGRQSAGHAGWLRRVVDPLLSWSRPWERAA